MIKRFVRNGLLFLLSGGLVASLYSAEPAAQEDPIAALLPPSLEWSNLVLHTISPDPTNDGRIAYVVADRLQSQHYSRPRFDAPASSKFLDLYIDFFDPQHIHFTQADLAEFEPFRTNLNRYTLTHDHSGDTSPAFVIFNRFMERFRQHVEYSDEVLRTESFAFDTDERVEANRHTSPFPKDLTEARKLWRERVLADYLAEKLARIDAKKKAGDVASDPSVHKIQDKPRPEREEIVETLARRYHRTLRMSEEWDHNDVLQIYLTTLAHVFDPHSDYMGKPAVDQFQIQMNLSLVGIGAELRSDDGYCTVGRLLTNGPAMKSGQLKPGDRIVAVAQTNLPPVDVVEMNLNKAVQLIRGIQGTEVRLTLIPFGADSNIRKVVKLIREPVPLEDSAAKAKLIETPDSHGGNYRLGVIDLPSFYAQFDLGGGRTPLARIDDPDGSTKSTTGDVARLLKKLKEEKVQGVILDLRVNGGGSLEEAIRLTGLFIKDGPIVQVRDYVGNTLIEADRDASVQYDGPLIVLTSRYSASASEILAGALQDYGRALIVGDTATHGKGTVQVVERLDSLVGWSQAVLATNDPGALKLTIKKFYRPSGASTQKRGVLADIVLPSVRNESKEIGEASLENALPYDVIRSAPFDQLDLVAPYLAELRKRSTQRVAGDKEFAYVREDIELYKKQQADKTVSLNQQQRLKELEEAEARAKARDQERMTRPAPEDKIYELTLKLANRPGLPAALTNNWTAKVSSNTNAPLALVSTNSTATETNWVVDTHNPLGAGTNAAVASATTSRQPPGPPVPDATLIEAEHILVDYFSLLPKGDLVTTEPRQPER